MDASAKRIYEAALGTPEGHLVIFLAHNGPTGVSVCQHQVQFSYTEQFCLYCLKENFCAGLGSKLDDICGKDWVVGGGDHGDPGNVLSLSLFFLLITPFSKVVNHTAMPLWYPRELLRQYPIPILNQSTAMMRTKIGLVMMMSRLSLTRFKRPRKSRSCLVTLHGMWAPTLPMIGFFQRQVPIAYIH